MPNTHAVPRWSRLALAAGALFPAADAPVPVPSGGLTSARRRSGGRRILLAAAYLGVFCVAFCVAVASQLLRVTGVPAWNSLYHEDRTIFLPEAFEHPWHLLNAYNGYEELVSRAFAQLASVMPLTWASYIDAIGSCALDVACALYAYHASAGFIRSRFLRGMLAAAILLMGIAPLEVVANPTNSQWYLMCALFWATLWRPRTWRGMTASAVVTFLAAATNPLAIVFAPVVAIRMIALRRPREHAVTIGYLLGWLPQFRVILSTYGAPAGDHAQRAQQLATPGQMLAFYFHAVVLRVLGWHFSWWLQQAVGWNTATVMVGGVVLAVLGWALTQGPQARLFVVVAVTAGLAQTLLAAALTPAPYVGSAVTVAPTATSEEGSRYTLMAIMALDAAAIVAVDALARRHGGIRAAIATRSRYLAESLPVGRRLVVMGAVAALVIGLAATWAPDYRYPTQRSASVSWSAQAHIWLEECQRHTTIDVYSWYTATHTRTVPCRNLVP